jgi:hypothetical protein
MSRMCEGVCRLHNRIGNVTPDREIRLRVIGSEERDDPFVSSRGKDEDEDTVRQLDTRHGV